MYSHKIYNSMTFLIQCHPIIRTHGQYMTIFSHFDTKKSTTIIQRVNSVIRIVIPLFHSMKDFDFFLLLCSNSVFCCILAYCCGFLLNSIQFYNYIYYIWENLCCKSVTVGSFLYIISNTNNNYCYVGV